MVDRRAKRCPVGTMAIVALSVFAARVQVARGTTGALGAQPRYRYHQHDDAADFRRRAAAHISTSAAMPVRIMPQSSLAAAQSSARPVQPAPGQPIVTVEPGNFGAGLSESHRRCIASSNTVPDLTSNLKRTPMNPKAIEGPCELLSRLGFPMPLQSERG